MPKTIHQDSVVFIMPVDRELQFAAIPIVQKYVNDYDARMAGCDVTKTEANPEGTVTLKLVWDVTIAQDHWNVFSRAGLYLTSRPQQISQPDMVIDMSDHRLLPFAKTGRHATQVCGVFCGEEVSPLPIVRKVVPKFDAFVPRHLMTDDPDLDLAEILKLKDNEVSCVIGRASAATYLAASMGLPVIELVPVDRHRSWLSKWSNPGYRLVRDTANAIIEIEAAKKSVQEWLTVALLLRKKEEAKCTPVLVSETA